MRVGVAYVDVRVNMTQFKKDLGTLANDASSAATRVNQNLSKIGVGLTGLGTTSNKTASGMTSVAAAADRQKKSFTGLIPHVAAVTASYMAMRAAWRGVIEAVGAGVQFEQKMSAVKAISRATSEEFVNLGVAARKMAQETVFTATETADALRFLAMAGFTVKESISALPGVLNLALIGELELKRATDIATDTLRAFGMEANQIERVVDVFTATITRTNTNIEMLGQAMKFAAPVAKVLGYEIEEVSAMIGILSQSGIKAGIAGRTLQQAFIRTQGAAANLGLTIGSNLIDVLKKYNELMEEETKRTNEVIARERIAAQVKKDYGLIAAKSILVLMENVEAYEKLAWAAELSAEEANRASLIMQDNVDSAWKILKSVIQDISIAVFDEYKGSIKSFLLDTADWFRANKDGIVEWFDKISVIFTGMVPVIQTIYHPFQQFFGMMGDALHTAGEAIDFYLPKGWQLKDWFDTVNPLRALRSISDLSYAAAHDIQLPGQEAIKTAEDHNKWRDAVHELVEAHKIHNAQLEKQKRLNDLDERAKLINSVREEGYAWELFTDKVENHAAAVSKAQKEAYDKLPASLRKIYDEQQKLKDIQAETEEQLRAAGITEPEIIKAMVDAKIALYKKDQKERVSEIKKGNKEAENEIKDFNNFVLKTDQLVAKQQGNKYDDDITKLFQYRDKKLEAIQKASDKELEIYREAGMTEEAIRKATNDRLYYLSVEGVEADFEFFTKELAETRKIEEANMKAIIDAKKSLLKELKVEDAEYFVLKKQILESEYQLALSQAKARGALDEEIRAIEAAHTKAAIKLMQEEDLQHKGMIKGMLVGLKQYQEQHQLTWGEAGRDLVVGFLNDVQGAFSTTFHDLIKGDIENIGDIWRSVWDNMKERFITILAEMAAQWLMSKLLQILTGTGSGTILGSFTKIFETSKEGLASMTKGTETTMEGMCETAGGAFTKIGDAAVGLWGSIKENAVKLWDWITGASGAVFENIKVNAAKLWEWIQSGAIGIWNWLSSGFSGVISSLSSSISSFWSWIQSGATSIWNWLSSGFSNILNSLSSAMSSFWDWISNSSSGVWDWLGDTASSIIGGLGDGFGGMWDWIGESATSIWDSVGSGFSDLFSGVGFEGSSLFEGLSGLAKDAYNWVSDSGEYIYNALADGAERLFGGIAHSGSGMFSSLVDAAKKTYNAMASILGGGGGSAGGVSSGGGIGGVSVGGIAADLGRQYLATGKIDVGATVQNVGVNYLKDIAVDYASDALASYIGGAALTDLASVQAAADVIAGTQAGTLSALGSGSTAATSGSAGGAGAGLAAGGFGTFLAVPAIGYTLGKVGEYIISEGLIPLLGLKGDDWLGPPANVQLSMYLSYPAGTQYEWDGRTLTIPDFLNDPAAFRSLQSITNQALFGWTPSGALKAETISEFGYWPIVTGEKIKEALSLVGKYSGEDIWNALREANVETKNTYGDPQWYLSTDKQIYSSFKTGIDYVPRDMLAYLHKGERVIPADEAMSLPPSDDGSFISSLKNAIFESFSEFGLSLGGGQDIHVHVKVDGREIGHVVAKQLRSNTELIESTRRVSRSYAS